MNENHNPNVHLSKIRLTDHEVGIPSYFWEETNRVGVREASLCLRIDPEAATTSIFLCASELLELYTALTGKQVVDESDSGLVPKERLESATDEIECLRSALDAARVGLARKDEERMLICSVRAAEIERLKMANHRLTEDAVFNFHKGQQDAINHKSLTRKQKSEITRAYLAECRDESLGQIRDFPRYAHGDWKTLRIYRAGLCDALLASPSPE